MGLDNPLHIAFLLVILLLVFGARRLPEMGRSLGEGLRGFKTAIDGSTTAPTIAAPQSYASTTPAAATPSAAAVTQQPAERAAVAGAE
jgi:sec-independent protein translocase protein TatA